MEVASFECELDDIIYIYIYIYVCKNWNQQVLPMPNSFSISLAKPSSAPGFRRFATSTTGRQGRSLRAGAR